MDNQFLNFGNPSISMEGLFFLRGAMQLRS